MSFDSIGDNETGVDKELKEFLLMEQKKAQFQQQVFKNIFKMDWIFLNFSIFPTR